MKLFGRQLFTFKRQPGRMYDFAMHSLLRPVEAFISLEAIATIPERDKKKKRGRPPQKIHLTPKGLYKLAALNDNNFSIKTDKKYLKEQISLAKEKLSLFPKNKRTKFQQVGGIEYGREEIESIIERLENRNNISKHKNMLKEYPHTTSQLIRRIVDENENIKCGKAEEFIPDFPKEAIKAMKEYNKMCVGLCGKETNFYVLASKKDFGEKDRRRDPILLAQSPFGFFWQILGAWDKEMIYLGDL